LYTTTALEDWVTDFYKRLNIFTPKDINEQKIAYELRIFLRYKEENSFYINGRFRSITIDSRLTSKIQRQIFYHELCHILRHVGRQTIMPGAFRELQERDARHFSRYAAIPHHMLSFIDFDSPYVVEEMSDTFKVTPVLCIERLEQIQTKRQLVAETGIIYNR
jgi:Zn-dependent peptidase ImmA (M78 family)